MGKKSRKKAAKKHAQRLLPKPTEANVAVGAPDFTPAAQTMFSDSALMETCRTQWQYGEWEALLQIDDQVIEADRDRAKLAALLASVHGHAGNPAKARQLADRAIGWGCSREILTRLMISAAVNTLGRATMAVGEAEASERYFRESISVVEPRADAVLLGQTRQIRETAHLGLIADARDMIESSLRQALNGEHFELAALQSDVAFLSQQVAAIQPTLQQASRERVSRKGRGAKVVVVAGVPRSGSTWLYNATRLLIEESGKSVYACWNQDYSPAEVTDKDFHVVKVHSRENLNFPYQTLLTTNRPLIDRLASLIRMGWLQKDEELVRKAFRYHGSLYEFWTERSDLEIEFSDISAHPERVVHLIASTLELPCNARTANTVVEKIDALKMPERGKPHDPLSQLHPGHRSDGKETMEIADWIASFLPEAREGTVRAVASTD